MRARCVWLLSCLLLPAGAQAQVERGVPDPGILFDNPYPEVERLLYTSELVAGPLTPAALAALPATARLMARLVTEPKVSRYLINHYSTMRRDVPAAYGLYLAGQFELQPHYQDMLLLWRQRKGSLAAHLSCYFTHREEPRVEQQIFDRMRRSDPVRNAQARALFEHRLPLDWTTMKQILAGLGQRIEPTVRLRLALLLPRITRPALAELARHPLPGEVRQALHHALTRAIGRDDARRPLVEAMRSPAGHQGALAVALGGPPAPADRPDLPRAPRVEPEQPEARAWPAPLLLACAGAALLGGWLLRRRVR